jgi:hypothetical protein
MVIEHVRKEPPDPVSRYRVYHCKLLYRDPGSGAWLVRLRYRSEALGGSSSVVRKAYPNSRRANQE